MGGMRSNRVFAKRSVEVGEDFVRFRSGRSERVIPRLKYKDMREIYERERDKELKLKDNRFERKRDKKLKSKNRRVEKVKNSNEIQKKQNGFKFSGMRKYVPSNKWFALQNLLGTTDLEKLVNYLFY
jgi:hypothetical protein